MSDAVVQMVVGLLIAFLCGACTLHFQITSNPFDRGWAGVALVIGGIPTLLGVLLFVRGYLRWDKGLRR